MASSTSFPAMVPSLSWHPPFPARRLAPPAATLDDTRVTGAVDLFRSLGVSVVATAAAAGDSSDSPPDAPVARRRSSIPPPPRTKRVVSAGAGSFLSSPFGSSAVSSSPGSSSRPIFSSSQRVDSAATQPPVFSSQVPGASTSALSARAPQQLNLPLPRDSTSVFSVLRQFSSNPPLAAPRQQLTSSASSTPLLSSPTSALVTPRHLASSSGSAQPPATSPSSLPHQDLRPLPLTPRVIHESTGSSLPWPPPQIAPAEGSAEGVFPSSTSSLGSPSRASSHSQPHSSTPTPHLPGFDLSTMPLRGGVQRFARRLCFENTPLDSGPAIRQYRADVATMRRVIDMHEANIRSIDEGPASPQP
ncbi:hypothetical protein BDZ90DRAFT_113809 [Jaminaea rosea]|uniref:Uncharacterized protein n=1 Tax=Jaminaea rosea TaxID=1569628 RepID=A0A316V2B4_9BASI|nr:hypothetical protein BDZ90DRAFT_113809 [Jaminaea rosea]PWN29565.1 hypothetical protein BDZ90DRAFT_113809 [Jaminaea rosea]